VQLKDGGYGDSDGIANGIIVDPSGFGIASWIKGFISDSSTGQKITTATLSFEGIELSLNSLLDGNFLSMILPGTYDFTISAPGYQSQALSNVVIPEAGIVTKDITLYGSDLESLDPNTNNSIYRFYNTVTGTHFYTSFYNEMNYVLNTLPQFNYEGVAFYGTSDSSAAGVSPVYRFYNYDTGAHFYTISEAEKDYILSNLPNYSFEGEAYYAYTTESPGTNALHRFFNTNTGTHFFTNSDLEKTNVQNTLPQYIYEGIVYYVK
jgi:hypothetical protein